MFDDTRSNCARKRLYFPDDNQFTQPSEYRAVSSSSPSALSVKYRRLDSIDLPSTPAKLRSVEPANYELLEFHGSSSPESNVFQSIPHRVTTLLSSPPNINSSPYNKASYAGINRSIQAQIDALINSYPQPLREGKEKVVEGRGKGAIPQLHRYSSGSHLLSLQIQKNGRAKIISPERTRRDKQSFTPSIHLYTPIKTRPSTRARVRIRNDSRSRSRSRGRSRSQSSKGVSTLKKQTSDLNTHTLDMSYSRLTATPRLNKSKVNVQSSPFGFCMDFLFNETASNSNNNINGGNTINNSSNNNIDNIFSNTGSPLQSSFPLQLQFQSRSSPNRPLYSPLLQQQQQQQHDVDSLLRYSSIDPLLQSEEGLMLTLDGNAAEIITGESLLHQNIQIQSPFISPPRTMNTSNFNSSNEVLQTSKGHFGGFMQRTMGELLGNPETRSNIPSSPGVYVSDNGHDDSKISAGVQDTDTLEPDASTALRKLLFNT